MRALPLYTEAPAYPVQAAPAVTPSSSCRRCDLHDGAKVVGVGHQLVQDGDGAPVLLLLPGMYATDGNAVLRDSARARFLRSLLPPGVRVYAAAATRCATGKAPTPEAMTACLQHTAATLRQTKAARVLVFGRDAAAALLGDAPPPDSVRGGYVFVGDVPVFLLDDPSVAMRNRFTTAALAADVRRAFTAHADPPPLAGTFYEVVTADDARDAARALAAAPWMTFDAETCGRLFDHGFRLLCAAAVPGGSDTAYVWGEDALNDPEVAATLLDLLTDPDVEKCGQNALYDVRAFASALKVMCRGVVRDTMMRRNMLNNEADASLEVQQALVGMYGGKADMEAAVRAAVVRVRAAAQRVVTRERGLFSDPEDALVATVNADDVLLNPRSYAYALTPRPLLHRYCARDAVSTDRVERLHEGTMRKPALAGVARVWADVMSRATDAVAQVSAWGALVSVDALHALRAYLNIAVSERAGRLRVGGITEPGDPVHVADVLFDRLKLPARYGTAGGKRSTASEALEEIEHMHPVVGDLLEWRRLDKLRGTYAEGLLRRVTPDGRVHVDFRITGARTGRMSAAGGLHGLPRPEDADARMVRDCFIAPPGHSLVELDLSQAELRVLAGLSRDPKMTATFVDGVDIHTRTAHMIAPRVWKIEPAAVQPKHRSVAKIINLSLAYGRGDAALAKEISTKSGTPCTKAEAGGVKRAIFGEFNVAEAWMKDELTFARQHGYARTYWQGEVGRRRVLWGIAAQGESDEARKVRGNAERAAPNTAVQGTTSDLVLFSLIEAVSWIITSGVRAKLVLTVHDSLLFEVHNDDVHLLVTTVKAMMERHVMGAVPIVADVKIGPAFGSLEKPR